VHILLEIAACVYEFVQGDVTDVSMGNDEAVEGGI